MIGVDEVGRGAWAGPLLMVAARATAQLPNGLKDSKLLKKSRREDFFELLVGVCQFGEGWVSAAEIDSKGLAEALRLGAKRALKQIGAMSEQKIIYDGATNYMPSRFKSVECIIGADSKIPIVSAASIYAKVKRDSFMADLMSMHPNYGFEKHVGYGTKKHQQALREFGPLIGVHRHSFGPIKLLEGAVL